MPVEPCDPCVEESEEAWLEGDTRFVPGTARSALSHPVFRTIFIGGFLSNIGSWMQQVVLGAFAYHLTRSPVFVGALIFAQMGPVLVLGPVAGVVADLFDRRRLLLVITAVQLASAGVLAWVVRVDDPSQFAIVVCVVAGGVANAVFMPAYSALLPYLVGRADLPGAISLQSAQMNLSRVIGPAIGGLAFSQFGPSPVFWGNAASFLFMAAALLRVRLPEVPAPDDSAEAGWRRLTSGFRIARRDPVVGRALVTIATFSTFCLLFVGQMAVFAAEDLGIAEDSTAYGVLYACFGLGAAVGSIAIGTVFAKTSKAMLVRRGFVAYAVTLAAFAMLRGPALAYPVIVVLGAVYFGSITALNTAMQARLANHERGRIMALWMMGFGGMVSVANFAFGPLIREVGLPPLMLGGAVVALALARYADLRGTGDDATSAATIAVAVSD